MRGTFRPEDWNQHTEALRRMARELLSQEDQAEDLVQTAYLAALERPPRALSLSWLKRVLRSSAQDVHRRRGRDGDALWQVRSELSTEAAPDTGDIVQQLEQVEILAACVRQLDEGQRDVVVLRYFDGLAPTEIARRLELPVKTVKTRLYRALAQLRERMERRYGREGRWQAALLSLVLRRGVASTPAPTLALGGLGAALMMKKLVLFGVLLLALFGVARMVALGRADASSASTSTSGPVPTLVRTDIDEAVVPDLPLAREPIEAAPSAREDRASKVAALPMETGSLTVRVTWSDGTPASGVGVALRLNADGLPVFGMERMITDEEGSARVDGLPAGQLEVVTDRGDYRGAIIEAGETRELRIRMEPRLNVQGRVVDAAGDPVADAGIWLTSGMNNWLGGRVVARSDSSGRFDLRSVPPGQSIGALAPGFLPSELVDLDTVDKSSPPVEVELKLAVGGGSLSVRVVHAEQPVVGASVAIGDIPKRVSSGLGGRSQEGWTPRTRRTNTDGRVRFEGLALGETGWEVRAEGFAGAKGAKAIVEGAANELEVNLSRGVTVRGSVRDATGEPTPQAVVRVFDAPISESFVQGGQYDYASAFGYPLAVTDERGEYRIDGVPSGELHMYASAPQDRRRLYGSVLHVHRVQEAEEGDDIVWDVDLVSEATITGRVTYAGGEPMPNVFVSTNHEGSGARQATSALEDGTFAFYSVRPGTYTVHVQTWDAPEGAAPILAEHVRAGDGELLLTAGYEKPVDAAPGEVRFRFLDSAERLSHRGALSMAIHSQERNWFRTHVEEDEDQFVFSDLPPGGYRLNILSGEDVIYVGETFQLEPGERLDLGTLESEPGGALVLEVIRPLGTEDLEPRVWVAHGEAGHGRWVDFGATSTQRVDNLTTGRTRLSMYGEGMTGDWGEVEVSADETRTFRFEVRPGVKRELEIVYPEGVTLAELHLRVEDGVGKELWDHTDPRPAERGRPYRRVLVLPLGEIRLRVTTDVGSSGRLDFEMTSLDEEQDPVRVTLK